MAQTKPSTGVPPWCQSVIRDLEQKQASNRLPHAMLFSGPSGLGKQLVARAFSQQLILQQSAPENREKTASLLQAGSHPDYQWITVEADKQSISVDQIRSLSQRLSLTSHAQTKIAVICLAEDMTTAAANALLKTLEEPPGDTLLLLVSNNIGRLPQTIRSRCQKVKFALPETALALSWLTPTIGQQATTFLHMAAGAPLTALEYYQENQGDTYNQLLVGLLALANLKTDAISMASESKQIGLQTLISWLNLLVSQLIQQKICTVYELDSKLNNSYNILNNLKLSADNLNLIKLYHYRDFLQQANREIHANLNPDLFLEEIFMRWQAAVSTR